MRMKGPACVAPRADGRRFEYSRDRPHGLGVDANRRDSAQRQGAAEEQLEQLARGHRSTAARAEPAFDRRRCNGHRKRRATAERQLVRARQTRRFAEEL